MSEPVTQPSAVASGQPLSVQPGGQPLVGPGAVQPVGQPLVVHGAVHPVGQSVGVAGAVQLLGKPLAVPGALQPVGHCFTETGTVQKVSEPSAIHSRQPLLVLGGNPSMITRGQSLAISRFPFSATRMRFVTVSAPFQVPGTEHLKQKEMQM